MHNARRLAGLAAVALAALGGRGSLAGPPADVDVHVVDEAKKPVAGARVTLVSRTRRTEPVATNDEGVAHVARPDDREDEWWILATAPGFVRGVNELPSPDSDAGPVSPIVVLSAGVEISGVVRGADGKTAIAGARVVAYEEVGSETDCTMPPRPPFAEGKSGADGAFVVGLVPKDADVRLTCEAAGHVGIRKGLAKTAARRAEFALPADVVLRGVVKDTAGKPVEGAKIRTILQLAEDDGPLSPRDVLTGPDGKYEVAGLARGHTYSIGAVKDGYGDSWIEPSTEIDEKTPSPIVHDFALPRELGITIRVTGPDGAAVDDAAIQIGDPETFVYGSTKSGKGTFTCDLKPGTLTISVKSPRFEPKTVVVNAVEGKPLELDVKLEAAKR